MISYFRFLRRLELSLIRKKECLTSVNRTQEIISASNRHDTSILARSDSWDTSREEDMSDSSESTSGDNDDDNSGRETEGLLETEAPLIPRSSSSPGTLCYKGPSNRAKPKGSSSKMLHMDLLDNCSATELLNSHKRRIRKYK